MKGKKPSTKIILMRKALIHIWWRNQKFYRQEKHKRIQHHQKSFTTNAKETSLGREHKRRKRCYKNKPKTIKKMVIGISISIITLILQPKDTYWLNGYKNKICIYDAYKRPTSDLRTHTDWKWGDEKRYFHANWNEKKAGVAITISDNINFKIKT